MHSEQQTMELESLQPHPPLKQTRSTQKLEPSPNGSNEDHIELNPNNRQHCQQNTLHWNKHPNSNKQNAIQMGTWPLKTGSLQHCHRTCLLILFVGVSGGGGAFGLLYIWFDSWGVLWRWADLEVGPEMEGTSVVIVRVLVGVSGDWGGIRRGIFRSDILLWVSGFFCLILLSEVWWSNEL